MLTIHAGSLALGFISGLIFYIAMAAIAALVLARKWDNADDMMMEEEQYKRLRDKYYAEDIFE